jgi:hypothetical protein
MLELTAREVERMEIGSFGNSRVDSKVINKVIRAVPELPKAVTVWQKVKYFGIPKAGVDRSLNAWRFRNLVNLKRAFFKIALAEFVGIPHFYGELYLKKISAGQVDDLGLASLRLITTNGVGFIVDAFENLVELEIMKFHGIGTGTNAENASDSALQTELTTQYNPDNTRATGTTSETSSNIYQSIGTNAVDAGVAITEHGLMSVSTSGSGVLFDRSVFSAVNLASGDSLQSTYLGTFNSGG